MPKKELVAKESIKNVLQIFANKIYSLLRKYEIIPIIPKIIQTAPNIIIE